MALSSCGKAKEAKNELIDLTKIDLENAEVINLSEMFNFPGNQEPENKIVIDVSKQEHKISPMLFGVFFEDINSAADGGLYAELIKNRSFEFKNSLDAWVQVKKGNGAGSIKAEKTSPLNENNATYLQITVEEAGDGYGAANLGYGGIALQEGATYDFSIYARSVTEDIKELDIVLEDSSGGEVYGKGTIKGIGKEWKKFTCSIVAEKTVARARLAIISRNAGTVDIDMVSLFPRNTWKNRKNGMRYDLANLIASLKPSFLRFPGGCFVEGNSLENAYRWKDTIGDIAERPTTYNLWGYYQSNGLGFYEYFQFCEDIGAEPVPVINCGMACQARTSEVASMSELERYIQDALDLIEYANGPVTSKWGALRKEHGHPEPFNLKYLAIGNEQWGNEYFIRYEKFYDAIKAKYPEIKLIFSAGPSPSGVLFDSAWKWAKKTGKADIIDEHYYMSPLWFFNNVDRYDDYDRNGPLVFVGEYAAHTSSRRNNMEAALAEAAFMTGLERNSDVVLMASYAPLLAKDGALQWEPDLIRFNTAQSYGTPSYYVQLMYSQNRGDYVLPLELTVPEKKDKKSIEGKIGLGTWSTRVQYKDLVVTGKDGQILYADDFSDGEFDWEIIGGNWTETNGELRQNSTDTNCYALTGDKGWSDYTISVKARKIGGSEGFLIVFAAKDKNNYYWWNLGGWGNTSTAIEKCVNGGKTVITDHSDVIIELGKWYDIKIELSGERIRCYLDGVLIHDVTDRLDYDDLYACSSIEEDGDIIIKVVNASDTDKDVRIVLNNGKDISPEGMAIILASDRKIDENNFIQPKRIYPVVKKVEGFKDSFNFKFAKNSFTILRISAKK